MAAEGAAGTLVWVLLPCGLLSAVLLRYSVLSAVYLALLLLTPLFCSPAACSVAGSTRHFLRVVGYTGVLFLLLQGALQLAFRSVPPDGAAWEQVLEHFGIIRFSRVDAGNIVRLLAPDIGVALVALVIARRSDRLLRSPGTAASSSSNITSHEEQEADGEWDSEDYIPSSCWEDSAEKGEAPKGLFQDFVLKATALACGWKTSLEPFFSSAGKVLVTLLLGLAGMLSPSVTSAVYFGAFLGLGSWWACRRALSALAFSALCVFMAIFTAGHLGSLYLYQLPFFQDLVPPDDLYARLLGMLALVRTTRTEPGKLHLHPGLSWPEIASPLVLLLSYYTLVFLLRQGAREPAKWEVTEELPGRLPSRGEGLELCSVRWASGSEEDQGTPFSSRSWQELPLLHRQEHRGQCSGVDSPAFPVPGKRETVPGQATSPPDSGANGSAPSSVSALGHLAMRHSYVPALIAMMAWSVTHASWLSFVLLLWACVVWMARDHRRLALLGAPCLVLYANLLLLLAFAAGLRASQEELFPGVPGWLLADLDLRPYAQPSLHLGAKSFYAFFFWLLLRQQVTERQMSAEAKEEAWGGETGEASHEAPAPPASSPGQARPTSVLVDILGPFLKGLLVKYWIFVCGAMFFVVTFHGKVVVYKIIYIFLFLTWVALYKLHYTAWRRTLRCFWVAVVFYSMVVLTAVYTYQFHTISGFFNQTLGLSKEGLHDMGLEQFDTTELFAKVLLPAAFLLACILQLHYFNEDFLKTTSLHNIPIKQKGTADRLEVTLWKLRKSLGPNREEEATQDSVDKASSVAEEPWKQEDGKLGWKTPAVKEVSSWDLAIDRLAAGFLKLLGMVNGTQAFLWRFLEIHILKIVSAAIVWLTLQEVSLTNALFYISWVASQPYSRLRPCTSHLSTVWACVTVICKMLYQLRCVVPSAYSSNCSEVQSGNRTRPLATFARESVLYLRPVDPAEWLGALRKCDGQVLPCLKSQLVILALVTLEVTVRRRQTFHRLQNGLPEPPGSSITAAVTRGHLDAGLLSALQYFINYGFYKFGLELCFVAALTTIGQRMDVYSFIHAIGLMYLLSLRRRKAIAEVWPRYCGFLVSLMILQYFLCLGLPPAFCKDYPWRTTSTEIHSNLIKWLYLPDFAKKPDANLLFYDFLLLLAASLQGQVFVDENSASVRMRAGDNLEISRDLRPEDLAQLSPGPGFIFCQSYLDMAKVAVFRYHFWLVLGLVFLAGTVRIHVFGAGYLVAFGYFLGRGRRLLSKPVKLALRPWDRLIAYSVSVVALKTLLSVGACVYLGTLLETHCWLVHSFGMYCTVEGYQLALPEDVPCEPPQHEAGILWDAVCFTFLLIQRRIFLSYYHLYVVADLKATEALASRGAKWLELSLSKALEHCEEEEKKSRVFITRQMEKIKAKQKKIATLQPAGRSAQALAASTSHLPGREAARAAGVKGDLSTMESEEERKWWQPWVKHPSMITDGSYSLFETDSEEEEPREGNPEEMEDHGPKPKTALQLAYDAWTNSSKSALRMRRQDEGWKGRGAQEEDGARRPGGGGEKLATCEAEVEAEAGISDEPESTAQRLVTMARLSWVLGAVLLDDVTEALATLSGEAAAVAAALRAERSAWWRAIRQGREASTRSILRSCRSPLRGSPQAPSAEGPLASPGSPAPPQPVQRDTRPADGMDEDRATEPQSGHTHGSSPDSCKGERDSVLTTRPQEAPLPPEGPRMPWDDELQQSDRFYGSLPRLVKLTLALYQLAVSKSEVLCYFVIVLNHTLSASVLSMVLPILSFLWAMLSVPRPSRRFWMAAIYYTEATVVVKYFSQFGFFPWTTKQYAGINREKPFSLPNILGIEKKDDFALCDLVQLLVLLFHRSTMEGLGLWDPPTSGQARCKKKSRKPRGGAGRGTPGSGHLGGQAERGHHSQQPPLQPSAHRRASGRGARGRDPGSRKRWRLFRKCHFSQNQLSRRTLKKQLEKARKLVIQRTLETFHSIRQFFYNVTHPEASLVCDVYTAIFLVETLNFAIILFGFWAFGNSNSTDSITEMATAFRALSKCAVSLFYCFCEKLLLIKKYTAVDLAESLSEDKVPETFLAMVLLQFGTMLVDRALYLRRTLRGKCALQVVLVLGIHCWLLVALPKATDRRFNLNPAAQLWYLVKCVYFGLSAYQIKCGYPQRIHGNFLTKNFNLCNLVLFKGFRFVPFLLELRAVIDWVWTDTALSLSNWVCLEDLYANIFIMKCRQESEKRYPQHPGQRKKRAVKYGVGGVLTLALVSLMWFPLVFMALLKTVGGVTNPPLDVSVRVAVDGYETLFSMRSQQRNLASFSDAAYDQLIQQYALHPSAMQFLANYRPEDVVLARIKSHSSQLWGISPADRAAMVEELANATRICVTVSWTIQRNVSLVKNVEASGEHAVCYPGKEPRGQLLQMLAHATKEPVMLPGLIPKALKTTAGVQAKMAHQLNVVHSQRPQDVDRLAFFRNATVRLQRLGPPDAGSPPAEWWVVQEWRPDCDQHRGCSRDLELVVYSDKVSPPSLGFLAGYGIVGLYVSVVMVVAKFIREHFLGISRSIMFDELPSVDRVLRLCSDIFLVRELGELELEQQLFAKLVFLYRSPETMIKWTRQRPADPAGQPPPDPVAGAPAGLGEAAAAS